MTQTKTVTRIYLRSGVTFDVYDEPSTIEQAVEEWMAEASPVTFLWFDRVPLHRLDHYDLLLRVNPMDIAAIARH